jgi:hypothetical protein
MALPAKNRPYEAESAGFGDSKHKEDNKEWAIFRRNPKGRGQFPPFYRCSSLQ